MSSRNILIVLDMQADFNSAFACLQPVSKLVKEWQGTVCFIHHTGPSTRYRTFESLVRSIPNSFILGRPIDDASSIIRTQIVPKSNDKVFLCGVNLDSCIKATETGLHDFGIWPTILDECCASSTDGVYNDGHVWWHGRVIGKVGENGLFEYERVLSRHVRETPEDAEPHLVNLHLSGEYRRPFAFARISS